MRFKITTTSTSAYDFDLLSWTHDTEAQVNRLGPTTIINSAYDWPRKTYEDRGWTDTVNSIWWPHAGDDFASAVVLLDDTRAALVKASMTAQVAGTAANVSPRPHLIVQALMSPKEGARFSEKYLPSGLNPSDTTLVATELLAWKMYPLPPVRLTQVTSGVYGGLWLLPLVDLRYFWRSTALLPLTGGTTTAQADPPFPLLTIDHRAEPDWMPLLRAYPDDSGPPGDYVAIDDNGTHLSIEGHANRGHAADKQADMEGWRIVCRDVRSNYNAPVGETQHSTFTGILSDYPDAGTLAVSSYHADAIRIGEFAGNNIAGGRCDAQTAADLIPNKLAIFFKVDNEDTYYEIVIQQDIQDPVDVADLSEDTDGLGTDERLYIPKAFIGCEVLSDEPSEARIYTAVSATVSGTLTGYSNGDVVTLVGGTLTTAATFTLTVAAGSVTAAAVTVAGSYSAVPTNPAAVSGGAGSGLTLTVTYSHTDSDRDLLVASAKQWAILYWRWRRKPCYYKMPGIAPVIPNGYAHMIRWDFAAHKFETLYVALDGIQATDDEFGSGGSGDNGIWIKLIEEGLGPDSMQAYYAWVEMEEDGAGGFQEKEDGLSGELDDEPARDSSFKSADPLGMVVRAKKGIIGDSVTVWWFITPDLDQDIMCTSDVPEEGAPDTQECPDAGGTIPGNWASGYVDKYNPIQDVWHKKETVWLKHINGMELVSDQRYRGHFCGYSPCVNEDGTGNGFIPVYTTADCCVPLGDGGPDDDTTPDDLNVTPIPSVNVPCCDVDVPITLTCTINKPACPLIDGITFDVVYQELTTIAGCPVVIPGACGTPAFGWRSRVPTAGELADCTDLDPDCPWVQFACCVVLGVPTWLAWVNDQSFSIVVSSCDPFIASINTGTFGYDCCGIAGVLFDITEP